MVTKCFKCSNIHSMYENNNKRYKLVVNFVSIFVYREKSSIQASQRRMERKLKELNAMLDQERTQHVEQRDQVNIKISMQIIVTVYFSLCWLNIKR